MTSKFILAAVAALAIAPSAFGDISKTLNGDQAISTIVGMIPLEIRTNAFPGTTSQGKECLVDIVLTNSDPMMLAIGISSGSEQGTNILVEHSHIVQYTYAPVGAGGLATIDKTTVPSWKISVRVPTLSSPSKRIVTIQGNHGTMDCAIDTNVTDN